MTTRFEWDPDKDAENQRKHGIGFALAQKVFMDPNRVVARDLAHSELEERFFCVGTVGGGLLTVRFTYRTEVIRIIGAGYWRKGRRIHEQKDQIHE